MVRRAIVPMLVALLAACASRPPVVGSPLESPQPTVTYSCVKVLKLRVRIDATSASVTIDNDGPYVLPQTSARLDVAVYSDGQRTLQIFRSQAYFSVGRGQPETCSRA
jgi:hypothetical protein